MDLTFEREWWGDCTNTFREEQKQIDYAAHMGLTAIEVDGKWPVYDLGGINVVDIGGGPCSMLLKCVNRGPYCMVVDPCPYPAWTRARYAEAKIALCIDDGMTFKGTMKWDEAWIYNCLEHVDNPPMLITNAWRHAYSIRLFEWLDNMPREGHPSTLTASMLKRSLGGTRGLADTGRIYRFADPTSGMYGEAYAGYFA